MKVSVYVNLDITLQHVWLLCKIILPFCVEELFRQHSFLRRQSKQRQPVLYLTETSVTLWQGRMRVVIIGGAELVM